ncbi:MAG: hypothetical protein ACYTFG_07175 [Planctomycetota bacterium]|jgi:pentatricopeptide repeat protein
MPADPKDLLLAEMVIQMGFVTRKNVDEALAEMEKGGFAKGLSEHLLETGLLTTAQMDLVDKFMDREPEKLPGEADEKEAEFGHLVEMKRLAATGDVEEALRLLEKMKGEGSYARLGEILMRKTVLNAAQIHQILEEKGIRILRCTGCQRKAEVTEFKADTKYGCVECKGVMEPVDFSEIPVADAGMDVVVVEEGD